MECKNCGHGIFKVGTIYLHENGRAKMCWLSNNRHEICGCLNPEPMDKKIVSDIPFNKITEMIIAVTSPKSKARRGLIAELTSINEQLRLIEDEKSQRRKASK